MRVLITGVARSWRRSDARFQQIAADLTNNLDVRRTVEEAGDIDVPAHVLGGFAGGAPVAQTGDETRDQMMNLNLRSAFLVFRAALSRMLERRRGRMDAAGSKGGVKPGSGVTANLVMPSTIDTEANRAAMPKADFSKWVQPASTAKVVSWLASDAAPDVSGPVVPVYGDAS
jgi:NAD(P)-dependent dehydrogenase (short-subunit alcohol dehydrogenase family)